MGFELSKWYADVIADDGSAMIVYAATLKLPALPTVHYAATIDHLGTQHTSLRRGNTVEQRDEGLRIALAGLPVVGTWTATAAPIDSTRLYASSDGAIDWHCLMPRASARVECAGRVIKGTGYVERLSMTLPAWRLPMDRLRWGRAHTGNRTVVWIDWSGSAPRRWVWLDGRSTVATDVQRDRLLLADGSTLFVDEQRTIRDGAIGPELLQLIPALARLPLSRTLAGVETKWIGRATLQCTQGKVEQGWALHEEVRWAR